MGDPARAAAELRPPLEQLTPLIIETLAMERAPAIWRKLPKAVKQELVQHSLDDAPRAISSMMAEIREDITKVFDLREMVVNMFTRDKQLTNDIFLVCGKKELKFIKISGFYLGFLFGLLQMFLWVLYKGWWLLPTAGFVVGYLTNWVALKMIFNPVHPRRCCWCTIQGLFLQRQKEVAEVYADLLSQKVLTGERLLVAMIEGSCSNNLFEVLDRHMMCTFDRLVQSKKIVKMMVGSKQYDAVKVRVCHLLRKDIISFVPHISPYIDDALQVRDTLESSLNGLSPEEFESLLHPVFEEDEIKLILVGGFLGVAIGMLQALVQVPDQFGL